MGRGDKMDGQTLSRRARYRAETREEAKEIALRQMAEGGMDAVSLNAIGKEMGVTGPALYRYFASRDALLTDLIVDAYGDLAMALETAVERVGQATPGARLRAIAAAIRAWALAQPHRYLLLYGTPVPGYTAPAGTVPLAQRVFTPILTALAESAAPAGALDARLSTLDRQFDAWMQDGEARMPGHVFRRGVIWWTRLHGLISLEVAGHFAGMGFDPTLLYEAEVDTLLVETGGAPVS